MSTSKRRERGDGGVYQRSNGKWQAYIYLGLDDNGKPIRKYIYGDTKDEVIKKRNAALAYTTEQSVQPPQELTKQPAVHTNVHTKQSEPPTETVEIPKIKVVSVQPPEPLEQISTVKKMKLNEWVDHWLETYVYSTVGESTYDWYGSLLETHVKPSLGHLWLDEVDTDMVQSFLARKSRKEKKSTSTVKAIRMVLHHSMNQAVTNGYILRNPVEGTKIARVRRKKPFTLLTKEQTQKLIDVASQKEYPFGALYITAVLTGMRQGELFGLAWDCIDLDAKLLRVLRVVENTRSEGPRLREYPKSETSCREIVISERVVEALQEYRENTPPNDRGLLFTNGNGGLFNKDNFRHRNWTKFKAHAGLAKDMSFHDLRHTHATQLLSKGIHPKVVSERLGHASVTFTMDTYQHYIPSLQTGIRNQLDDLV